MFLNKLRLYQSLIKKQYSLNKQKKYQFFQWNSKSSKEGSGSSNSANENSLKFEVQQIVLVQDDKDNSSIEQKSAEQVVKPESVFYDIAIIGGGSGGLALCQEAEKLGLRCILFDYVDKSPKGNVWGLGGTCVNVGCIPKKLFHEASLFKERLCRGFDLGHNLKGGINNYQQFLEGEKFQSDFDWGVLVKNVREYILNLNLFYESLLSESKSVEYRNSFAAIWDKETVIFGEKDFVQSSLSKGNLEGQGGGVIKAKNIVISTGGRPSYDLNCKNLRENSITSDDVFFLERQPKKVLLVGGGYISLELAGILGGFESEVKVVTRNRFLGSFDQQMSQMIVSDLQKNQKVQFERGHLPFSIEKNRQSQIYKVGLMDFQNGKKYFEYFDQIILAIGRKANIQGIGLERVGIETKEQKILANLKNNSTNVPNIFAIGDVVYGAPELTPLAIKQGKRVAQQIYLKQNPQNKISLPLQEINYSLIPTTIFTPLEYSYVGMSEEQAKENNKEIIVYHSRFPVFEDTLYQKWNNQTLALDKRKAYMKIICDKNTLQVLGAHYYGNQTSDVVQTLAVAMQQGITFQQIINSVGIHPTDGEEIFSLNNFKPNPPDKKGC